MFCEKCGNPMNDGEKFCQKCGAPVPGQAPAEAAQPVQQAPEQAAPQPQQYAPVADQAAQPQQYAPVAGQAAQQPQQYAPVAGQAAQQPQQYAPVAPKGPKKPLSPMMKKIILFGGIGVAVLAAILVLLFVVIVPGCQEAARVDITKYFTMKIDADEGEVLDDKISGSITFDYAKYAKDFNTSESAAKDNKDLQMILGIIDVKVTKDGEDTGWYNSEMSSDDVYTVTVSWPTENNGSSSQSSEREMLERGLRELDSRYGTNLSEYTDPKKAIENAEKNLKVEFKHKTLSREIKIADALEEQDIKLIEPTEMDVLKYIQDNNLLVQEGHRSGDISLSIDKFETTFGDYTVSKANSDYYTGITVKKGDKEIGSFSIELSSHYDLKSNEEITVSYDSYAVSSLEDKGVKLTGDEFTYTVVGPEEFTADVAKKNVEALKTYFNDNVKKEDWKAADKDQITINNIYHSSDSDSSYIVYVYTNTTQKYCKTMYMNAEYLYMEDGALKNDSYCSTDLSGKDVKEAVSYCSYLKSPYTPTQIL